ncbi:hypothetical protein GIB67_018280 [Kingdonia uniflora]|uniref:Uncharacterized protein n=1 Tax=Kingdonia uniflora TaxID=39325 RepID=A0A7J7LF68_9MAGN|nr:hypothetical protein GIB67_018280 [Kingdonia uniflora]
MVLFLYIIPIPASSGLPIADPSQQILTSFASGSNHLQLSMLLHFYGLYWTLNNFMIFRS